MSQKAIKYVTADLCDYDAVLKAVEGALPSLFSLARLALLGAC